MLKQQVYEGTRKEQQIFYLQSVSNSSMIWFTSVHHIFISMRTSTFQMLPSILLVRKQRRSLLFFIEAIDLIRVLRTTADDKAAGQSHFQSQKYQPSDSSHLHRISEAATNPLTDEVNPSTCVELLYLHHCAAKTPSENELAETRFKVTSTAHSPVSFSQALSARLEDCFKIATSFVSCQNRYYFIRL
jgi:hypothetical protein